MVDAYDVSVLTPVRDVPVELLERACRSLRRQTYGFERLQWVVVMHNCGKESERSIRTLLGAFPNVTLVRCFKPGTGISYAKNKTFEPALGKWIFFLDGDDEMMPDCIQTVVGAMENAQADMGVFGAEIITPATAYRLLPPTDHQEGSMPVSSGGPKAVEGLYACGLANWTQCYKRSFLQENGLRFDESLALGEDFVFTARAARAAGQFILVRGLCGYRYYMGRGSASFVQGQGRVKAPEESIRAADALAEMVLRFFQEIRALDLKWDTLVWMMIHMNTLSLRVNDTKAAAIFLNRIRIVAARLTPPSLTDPERNRFARQAYRNIWGWLRVS